ncbi:MAG: flagellar hook-associated protein FlgK [Roseateles depolymerans]|uniref:Flagellar hook-associated protein 1 n=1 Tax=Roseateles depolymerans TaxID=76731 RepID=A0A2W5FZH9_9BURK|nr:MAG: flagellar hook-associated protein FlgK [Roseateles depolymerans]
MSSLLSLGARAMLANQSALQTIGQNISNANTPGYSRQTVVLTTADGQYTGAGFFGRGVDVQTVERSHNDFLTRQAISTKSTAVSDQTRADQLGRIEKLFPTGEAGIGYAASQFLNSLQDVASRPADPSARQVVLGRAAELSSRFQTAGSQLADLQSGIVSDLRAEVATVNGLAEQIAAANDQIARLRGSGHTPNDLLDKRDQLIAQLSEHVGVSTLPADDGTVGVFIGGGQRLVLGSNASKLALQPDNYDPTRVNVSLLEGGSVQRPLNENVLTGGSISALLYTQNHDLQDARNLLGQMAAALGTRINDQNALGLDLSDPPGQGGPIFNVAQPRVLPSTTNVRDGNGGLVSGVQATIVDASRLQASSYKLSADAAGAFQLTRLSDGVVRTVADGDTIDGFKLSFAPAAPTSGESFLIEPVGNAATEMRRVLDLPNGIAAASPLTASTDVSNAGTMTVDSVYATSSTFSTANIPKSLQFSADPSNPGSLQYSFTMADGSSTAPQTWTAGQPVGAELGFALKLNGVPRDGDSVTLAATTYPSQNNGNAKAFLDVQTDNFIGRQLLSDGSLTRGTTINDAYAAAMSDIGARVQSANYLSGVSTSVSTDAQTSLTNQVGVNLDEEASRLMQFQQSYQAAAKVLQTAQSLFDELLRIAGS